MIDTVSAYPFESVLNFPLMYGGLTYIVFASLDRNLQRAKFLKTFQARYLSDDINHMSDPESSDHTLIEKEYMNRSLTAERKKCLVMSVFSAIFLLVCAITAYFYIKDVGTNGDAVISFSTFILLFCANKVIDGIMYYKSIGELHNKIKPELKKTNDILAKDMMEKEEKKVIWISGLYLLGVVFFGWVLYKFL